MECSESFDGILGIPGLVSWRWVAGGGIKPVAGTNAGTVRKKAVPLPLADEHDMASHEKPSPSHLQMQNNPPTTPGAYWFQSENTSRAVMVEVRVTNGELTVWWLTRPDEPVANLKGRWRGPIPP